MGLETARRGREAVKAQGSQAALAAATARAHARPVELRRRTARNVTAVLGPTNTGKTHLAIERMVAQPSGIIGLPLRLLAREVYARVRERVGPEAVALITGEEKIIPEGARFRVCTVEAMPSDATADFVAIDEVQLAADLSRGHVFTDRVLHMRGVHETMLLGAATLRPALEALLPGIDVVTRPRMSELHYAGSKKITRLPRRSAIVAFSADEVYAIAELIRRQRGAAAVVTGSLSPRTRNAQVALYQSGDVDFLVATDAIGMGLNLDLDHVAFAQDVKFDGTHRRRLKPAEMAQIAGRAGRHTRDGTFGVTGRVDPFDDELVQRLESHEFPAEKALQWRNRELDFATVTDLIASLERPSADPVLVKAPMATDQRALTMLAATADIRERAEGRAAVERLWAVAQVPDYRKIAPANHADMLASIYRDLTDTGCIDEDWFAAQVALTDNVEGDIDALSNRIAHIRTWTFVSHRADWLADAAHWQERTRAIEDRLSDALHDRLTKRFVDRRTSVLMKRLREKAMLEAEVASSGDVTVEGHHVGQLTGFRFTADATAAGEDAKAMRAAAAKALAGEMEKRADRLTAAPNSDLVIDADGTMRWVGAPVARLVAGDDPLAPRVVLLADDQLEGQARERVQTRLERRITHQIQEDLKPLLALKEGEGLSGMGRGIAFRVLEKLGVVDRRDIAADLKELDQDQRAQLRKRGLRFGAYHVFAPALLKPAPARLLSLLHALHTDRMDAPGRDEVLAALAQGRTSFPFTQGHDEDFYRLAGFRVLGPKAVRIDILERLADQIRPAISWKPPEGEGKGGKRPAGAWSGAGFTVVPDMLSILGATHDDMAAILSGLGYRSEPVKAGTVQARHAEWDGAPEAPPAAPDGPTPDAPAPDAPAPEAGGEAEPATVPTGDADAEVKAALDGTGEAVGTDPDPSPADAPPQEAPEEAPPVLVWRPARNDRGQRPGQGPRRDGGRGRGPRRDEQAGEARGRKDTRPPRGPKGNGPGKGGGKPAPRPERKPDPDSPFAQLAALKDQLKK